LESAVARRRLIWNHRQYFQWGWRASDRITCFQRCRFCCNIQSNQMARPRFYEGGAEGQGHGQTEETRDVRYVLRSDEEVMLMNCLCQTGDHGSRLRGGISPPSHCFHSVSVLQRYCRCYLGRRQSGCGIAEAAGGNGPVSSSLPS
jgi:hypothetical protein